MRRSHWLVGFLLLVAGASTAAPLQFTSTPAAPIQILDNDGANPIFDTIDTSTNFGVDDMTTFVSIDLMLNHTWVGDLEIVLRSPGGVALTIMARPGNSQPEGDSGSPFGSGANFDENQVITFEDGAATSAEDMGTVNVLSGVIQASSYAPDPTNWDTDIDTFAEFVGSASGLWRLEIGDWANADTGELVSWTLNIIPEPSTGLLLGSGLLAMAGARRGRLRRAAIRG